MTNANDNHTGSNRSNVITQDDLRKLQELRDAKKLIEKYANEQRNQILAAFEANYEVEPGELTLSIDERETQHLTNGGVEKVVGSGVLKQILDTIPTKKRITVWVIEKAKGKAKGKAQVDRNRGFNTDEPEFVDLQPPKRSRHGVPTKAETSTPVFDDEEFQP